MGWTRQADHLVVGVASAASAVGGGFGRRRSDGYRGLRGRREGWAGSEAHGESDEGVSDLGNGPEQSGRQGGSPAIGEEEDDVGGITGRPNSCDSVKKMRTTWQSSRTRQGSKGVAVAAQTLVGNDGCGWVSSRERARGGEREQRVRERGQRLRGVSVASLEGVGEAGGGQSRVEVARAWRAHALVPSGTRLKEAVLWLGRYSGGLQVGWIGKPGTVPSLFFLFLFFYSCYFVLI